MLQFTWIFCLFEDQICGLGMGSFVCFDIALEEALPLELQVCIWNSDLEADVRRS